MALTAISCTGTKDISSNAAFYSPSPEKEISKASAKADKELMEIAEGFRRPYDHQSKHTLKVKFYDSLDNLVYEDSVSPGERKSEALIQMLHRSDYLTNWEEQAYFRVNP